MQKVPWKGRLAGRKACKNAFPAEERLASRADHGRMAAADRARCDEGIGIGSRDEGLPFDMRIVSGPGERFAIEKGKTRGRAQRARPNRAEKPRFFRETAGRMV